MTRRPDSRPDWNRLYETAAAQEGHFSTRQAADAGYSPQLLAHHLRSGRVARVRRGVYRLVHFPAGEHEDLVAIWLWSERTGVFSHETALRLFELSDALPSRVHLTLPADWSARRLRVPEGLSIVFADLEETERTWVGPIPVTTPARTLRDCAEAHVATNLLRQATRQALSRGLIDRKLAEASNRAASAGATRR